ncbi:MAG: dihydropteroate synthase [Pseudomonadales bacterium]
MTANQTMGRDDRYWCCGKHRLSLQQPLVMGILNITPDSFSDGGQLWSAGRLQRDNLLRLAEQMHADGAAIFDIGGESTRPGASEISVEQESERILPALEALHGAFDLPISVDTSSPRLMTAAGAAGAAIINDVRGLRREGAMEAVARTDMGVCIMHMQGEPSDMQQQPSYDEVGQQVGDYLATQAKHCETLGIAPERIAIDPGFGFGKTLQHNLALFRYLPILVERPWPVLIGISRKSMIGAILGKEVENRLAGALAMTSLASYWGVRVFRTHDVAETCDALRMIDNICN